MLGLGLVSGIHSQLGGGMIAREMRNRRRRRRRRRYSNACAERAAFCSSLRAAAAAAAAGRGLRWLVRAYSVRLSDSNRRVSGASLQGAAALSALSSRSCKR